jgi:hypothetical protein
VAQAAAAEITLTVLAAAAVLVVIKPHQDSQLFPVLR